MRDVALSASARWGAASPAISIGPDGLRRRGTVVRRPRRRAGLSAAVALVPPSQFGRLEVHPVRGAGLGGNPRCAAGGLLGRPHDGQMLIDLTTSHPAETRAIAAQAKATGRDYVDCGMTGGAKAADAGTITLMVGGSPATRSRRASPLFDADRRQGVPCRRDRHRARHEADPQHGLPHHLPGDQRRLPARRARRHPARDRHRGDQCRQRAQLRLRAALSQPHHFAHLRRPLHRVNLAKDLAMAESFANDLARRMPIRR